MVIGTCHYGISDILVGSNGMHAVLRYIYARPPPSPPTLVPRTGTCTAVRLPGRMNIEYSRALSSNHVTGRLSWIDPNIRYGLACAAGRDATPR